MQYEHVMNIHELLDRQDRRELSAEILGRVHRIFVLRLENIRLLADRTEPDGKEIVSIVRECEDKLHELCSELGF